MHSQNILPGLGLAALLLGGIVAGGLKAQPADPPAWEARGNALWFLGRLEEAFTLFLDEAAEGERRPTGQALKAFSSTDLYAATMLLRLKRSNRPCSFKAAI